METKRLNIFLYIAIFGIISFFFFSFIAYRILLLPPLQTKALNVAGKELSKIITGDIWIGRVESNLLSYVNFEDVYIRDRSNPNVYVYATGVKIHYYLPSLLKKRVRLLSMDIDRFDTHLRVTKKGVMQIPFLLKPSVTSKQNNLFKDWEFKLGTLKIGDMNVSFNDSLMRYYSAANHAKTVIKFPRIDSVMISLNVPDGYFYSDWWNGNVDTLQTDLMIQPSGIYVDHAYARGSGSTVHKGYGRIAFTRDGRWDLHAEVSSSIRPIYALETYAPDFDTIGHARAKASFMGSFRKPLYSVELSGGGLTYNGITLDTFAAKSWTDAKEDIHWDINGKSLYGDMKLGGNLKIMKLNSFHPIIDKYKIKLNLANCGLPLLINKYQELKRIPGDSAALDLYLEGTGYRDLPKVARAYITSTGGNIQDTLEVAASVKNHDWSLLGDWGNNHVSGMGTFDNKGALNGTVNGQIRSMLPVSSYFLRESIPGNVSFDATLGGTIKAPVIKATIGSSNLKWRGSELDTLDASVVYNKKLVINKGFCVADINIDSIARVYGGMNAGGMISVRMNASGPVENPKLDIRMNGSAVRYGGQVVDACEGNVKIDGLDNILLNEVSVVKGDAKMRINGMLDLSDIVHKVNRLSADLDIHTSLKRRTQFTNAGSLTVRGTFKPDSMDVALSTSDLDLSVFDGWVKNVGKVRGRISLVSSVAGSLENPSIVASVRMVQPGYDSFSIKTLSAHCILKDSLFSFDSTAIELDSVSTFYLNGSLPLTIGNQWALEHRTGRPGKVFIQSKNLELGYFSRLLNSDWKFKGRSLVSLDITKGRDGWMVDGIANINGADLRNRAAKVLGDSIMIESSIHGSLLKPVLSYSVTTGKFIYDNIRIDSTQFKGMVDDDSLHISSGVLSLFNGGVLSLDGMVPLMSNGVKKADSGVRLNFNMGNLACTELNVFTGSELIRGGTISAAGTIGLRDGQPRINGKIIVEKGVFTVDGIEPNIGPVNAEFVLTGDTVRIAKCRGAWGNGTLESNGFIVWCPDSIKDVALNCRLRNFSAELPDIISSTVQKLDFSFTKRKDGFLVNGNADLGATRIIRDFKLNDVIDQMNYSAAREMEENQFLNTVHLNVKVNLIENPVLDINLGYLEFSGGLTLTGTAAHPSFVGDLSVADGYVLYLDRQFDIVAGHIANYNQYVINPTIDLSAKTDVTYIGADSTPVTDTVKLKISGALNKVGFRLSSVTSSLSEADIISILTLGQRLGSVGDNLTKRIKAFAGQSLLGLGTRKLEQFLDIDRINVSGDIFDTKKESSATLTVTKRISPKLMVSYETAIANLSRRKISAFYSLTKYFYLLGETENKGESGIDFIFKYSK